MGLLENELDDFIRINHIKSKGSLSVMIVMTRRAQEKDFPLKEEDFLTKAGGQVKGLGKNAVQKILNDYGIHRTLAEEGGRTSRGSINNMNLYIDFLNMLYNKGILQWGAIEKHWINQVKRYFSSTPFKIRMDTSKSTRVVIRDLLDDAFKKQSENPGTMYAGAVMQHLVGAKLKLVLPNEKFDIHGFSVADQPSGRKGDFLLGSASIHVTTAPTEALIRKCLDNLNQGLKPVIVTTSKGAGGAEALAGDLGIAERIDIFEIEQFVATNVMELGRFVSVELNVTVRDLVKQYNNIINACETDPSLKIELA
ncbi:DUF4928 family protein [candidate division KSB1 bacterium]|nr:DUF4928 family protein [candidate division KSB1 bacterium]